MKKGIAYLLTLISLALLTSCGESRRTFLLEGTFKGFNQGELYICDLNGGSPLDTVAVVKSQFRYEIALEDSTAFIVIFPNFSEVPVYGEPGATVTIEGDVSHLREIEVEGTDENEVMTKYRKKTSQQTPPEVALSTEQFIKDNPASPFALYLIRKVFIQSSQPDYKRAADLMALVIQANPSTSDELKAQMKQMDINGETVKSADLNAKVNVITVWNTDNYEGMGILRQLQKKQNDVGDDLKILTICMEADLKACRLRLERDSITWHTICDPRLWNTPIIQQIGLSYIPDNILIDDKGKIIAHSLSQEELMKRIEKLLPKKEE